MKKVIIGADHRGYHLKETIKNFLIEKQIQVEDAGTHSTDSVDYPDITAVICRKIQNGEYERGIIICGSGVGASVTANKFKDIRAAICHDDFSAHQGVEDDAMNVLCLGGGIIGESLAKEIVITFLFAEFKPEERYKRRLEKIRKIENDK